jgi:hypothetical protein
MEFFKGIRNIGPSLLFSHPFPLTPTLTAIIDIAIVCISTLFGWRLPTM